jgi:hypothetical protein
MSKYKLIGKKRFTKHGHTMFFEDVLRDLKRKEYLQDQFTKQRAEIKELKIAIGELVDSPRTIGYDEKSNKLNK